MEACGFVESNAVLGPPEGMGEDQVRSLSVFRGRGVVVSCHKLTAEELEEINKTGRVWLVVHGKTMPPVFLTGINPLKP